MTVMDQATYNGHATAAGSADELNKALAEKKRAAFFVREGTTVMYAIAADDSPYDPLWMLFGSGYKPKDAYVSYAERSSSENGILKLLGERTTVHQVADASVLATRRLAAYRRITMDVGAALSPLFAVPGAKENLVADIQAENPSVKADTGSIVFEGTRNVHRLYMAAAFTLLRKKHGAGDKDGVVALVVDGSGNIVSWGQKNPDVPCWHGETSAIMRLGGRLPGKCCIYSTLKPCHMCASLIHQMSGGNAKVFWGQNDPAKAAAKTDLDTSRMGRILDGNKPHAEGAKAVLIGARKEVMSTKVGSAFKAQKKTGEKSTIDYITTPAAADFLKQAEAALVDKYKKYQKPESEFGNENTRRVADYLIRFLRDTVKVAPEGL